MIAVPYVDLVRQNEADREAILEAVGRVIDHGQYINGPEVRNFEARMADFTGSRHVIGCSSGTSALTLALRAHGIGPGDEVVTVSHSCVATATSIRLVGATPVFADIDPETGLIDPAAVRAMVTASTRAVLPVHLGGAPCPMDDLVELCAEHGMALIEDCAQAIGARYDGRHVGNFGTGCFSLHPLKTLSALGDAGFITTDDDALAERLVMLRNIGLRDRDHLELVGENARLDAIHAAILLVKLERLPEWIAARNAHARAYEALSDCVSLFRLPERAEPAYSCFAVRHPRRNELLRRLTDAGVDAKIHYPIPIHRQTPFRNDGPVSLPATERVVEDILSLPVAPEVSAQQIDHVIHLVRKATRELS